MHTPTAVVFDLGKVLLDFDYLIAARNLAEVGKLTREQIRQVIDASPLLFQYETGLMTSPEFYRAVCQATGFGGTETEFTHCFGDIFQEIPDMVELHATLRRTGIPAFIFSNTNEIAISHIRQRFPFFSHFDGYILSYEQKAMKPHPKIYQAVEALTARKGPDLLYIDDRPENIETGAKMGWQVILHQHPGTTRNQVRALGLPV